MSMLWPTNGRYAIDRRSPAGVFGGVGGERSREAQPLSAISAMVKTSGTHKKIRKGLRFKDFRITPKIGGCTPP
jgi:hypothetical protein